MASEPRWTQLRQCLTFRARAAMTMRTHPLIPNALGELVMIVVMPVKAPIAMTAFAAGLVASSNLSSMEEAQGGGSGGGRIKSVLLIY